DHLSATPAHLPPPTCRAARGERGAPPRLAHVASNEPASAEIIDLALARAVHDELTFDEMLVLMPIAAGDGHRGRRARGLSGGLGRTGAVAARGRRGGSAAGARRWPPVCGPRSRSPSGVRGRPWAPAGGPRQAEAGAARATAPQRSDGVAEARRRGPPRARRG